MSDLEAMQAALSEAQAAGAAGEVPIGAVVLREGRVIATGQNRVMRDLDPTAHAEIVALRAAASFSGNYRLTDCTLATTLEPCAMCAGALVHARIARLVYAVADPKAGAVSSVMQVLNHPALNRMVEVAVGPLAEESATLLQSFFRERRPPRGM
jgi:tRNA(adenine34) deaminase